MASTATQQESSSRDDVRAQARADVESRRSDAEQRARQDLDRDAIQAVEETRRALQALADGKTDDAVAAIERATGKIDVLTARHPEAALLPVDASAYVIDTAPAELDAIKSRADLAVDCAMFRDFPTTRVVLAGLISEIRIRTFRLPLATYPTALREAARLLDEKKFEQARAWIETALNTLVVVDRVIPLPLLLARAAIEAAEDLRDRDREAARRVLGVGRTELERAMELGYALRDDEYKTLHRTISDLEKQLKGTENTTSAFAKLKERLAEFVRRLSESPRDSLGRQSPPRPQTAQAARPSPQGEQRAAPGYPGQAPVGTGGPQGSPEQQPARAAAADQPRGTGAPS
jgi:hypothetical protein